MTWRIVFYGREVGAIGTLSRWELIVDAPDIDTARIRLYDTHEHISIESIERAY